MTSFKKMRLVPETFPDNKDFDATGTIKHQTPVLISRMTELDNHIHRILNQDLDESIKAKLYSQALRSFMTLKKLKQESDVTRQTKGFRNLRNLLLKEIPKQKGIKIRKKRQRKRKQVNQSVDDDFGLEALFASPERGTKRNKIPKAPRKRSRHTQTKKEKRKRSKETQTNPEVHNVSDDDWDSPPENEQPGSGWLIY